LLIDPSLRPLGGLKVREHKTLGVYIQLTLMKQLTIRWRKVNAIELLEAQL
jgi:hypothetical protein